MTNEARIHIVAQPERLYGLVSDVTRMGEWSPETVGADWLDGALGPAVGARFKGRNKRRLSWATTSTVTAADPGRRFSFATGKAPDTTWTYTFAPAGDGTDVTESFEITKPPGALGRFLCRLALGISWSERETDLVRSMEQTLNRLKAEAEG